MSYIKYFHIISTNVAKYDIAPKTSKKAKYWLFTITVEVKHDLEYKFNRKPYELLVNKVPVPVNMELSFIYIDFVQYNSKEDLEKDRNAIKKIKIRPKYSVEDFKKFLQEQGFTQKESEDVIKRIKAYIKRNYTKSGTDKKIY